MYSLKESDDYIDRVLVGSYSEYPIFIEQLTTLVVDSVSESTTFLIKFIGSQIILPLEDVEMVDEHVLVDLHIIDQVPLAICMDEYRAWAWEVHEDRNIDMDSECLHFDIDKNDLQDDSESAFMVDTRSSTHCEPSKGTIS